MWRTWHFKSTWSLRASSNFSFQTVAKCQTTTAPFLRPLVRRSTCSSLQRAAMLAATPLTTLPSLDCSNRPVEIWCLEVRRGGVYAMDASYSCTLVPANRRTTSCPGISTDERLRCYLCVTVAPAAADDDALKRLLMDAECRATVGESSTGSAPPGPSRPGTAASTRRESSVQASHNTANYAAAFWNGREAYANNVARPLINGQGTCALIPLDLTPFHYGSTSPSADTVTLSVNLFVRERSHDAGHDSTFMQATSAQTADGALVRTAVASRMVYHDKCTLLNNQTRFAFSTTSFVAGL